MTAFTDTFLALHAARRALKMARELAIADRMRGGNEALIDDVVTTLAREVARCERETVDLVGVGVTLENGARIVTEIDDRRLGVRPRFIYKRDTSHDKARAYAGSEAAE